MSTMLRRTSGSSWIWLLAGALVLPFAGSSQTVIPVAAWLAPVGLLRFSRTASRGWLAWGTVALVYAVAIGIGFRNGLVPLPPLAAGVIALLSGVIRSLGYAIDRALAPSLSGVRRSLVFPVAMTAVEWLSTRFSPFGSWGSMAYTQAGNLPLVQIVSVTGLWGLTFLIHWLAPAVDALRDETPGARRPTVVFAASLAGILLLGGARLAFFPPDASSAVPVAAVTLSDVEYTQAFAGWKARDLARASEADRAGVRVRLAAAQERLLERTGTAASAGAKIVSWPESTPVLAEDLDGLLERGKAIARRAQLHLVMTPWVIRRTDRFPYVENLSVLIDPAGRIGWRYPKNYPVLGIEDRRFGRGPGIVPLADSPHGRLATVICQDLDFPWLVQQVGRGRAGLLIGPADDWPAIRPIHAQMAVFRAIENGASLLRATNNGISLAVDSQGRVRGGVETRPDAAPLLLTALPVSATATVYSRLGDWFAWLCLVALAVISVSVRKPGFSASSQGV